LTILIAVALTRGRRPAPIGSALALALLGLIVLIFGLALALVPIALLGEFIGLFVDYGALVLIVGVLVTVVAMSLKLKSLSAFVGGIVRRIGCLGVPAFTLVQTARER
jgi:uncharacterized membrane protein